VDAQTERRLDGAEKPAIFRCRFGQRSIPLVLLVVASAIGCGDTDPPAGTGGDGSSTTSSTQEASDEEPDTYNDEDNDGKKPHEG